MSDVRKRYRGSMTYESSYDGKAIFRVGLYRKTRTGTAEWLPIEVELNRSSSRCLFNALKKFADAEREAIKELPL